MGNRIDRRIRYAVLLAAAMTALLLSCSNVPSSPTSTVEPTVSTPAPTINGTLPAIQTYEDLEKLRNEDPAKIDNSRFPITPVEALHETVAAPPVDIAAYTFTVDGLVNTPLSLSYDDILNYSPVSEVVLLICEGAFVDNAEWTGVPVSALLAEAGVKPEAAWVSCYGLDRYRKGITIEDAQKDGVFLAYRVNGEELPPAHGYPLRLVVKGKNGVYWVKWANRLEVH